MTVKSTGCEFDPLSKKLNIYLYFHFFAALSSATQHAIRNLAESGERSVLTLGSLCLPAECGIQREAKKNRFFPDSRCIPHVRVDGLRFLPHMSLYLQDIACLVAELNAALPERRNENIKYIISSNGDRTHNHLQ